MATMTIGAELFNVEVSGDPSRPWLMLANSLGTDLSMWDAQMPDLARRFHVVRYDSRGHGGSVVSPGPYSIAQLGRDALAILDALGISRTHWLGLSKGGMVGQWLLAHHPERIDRAVLANTSARMPGVDNWNLRIRTVLERGMDAVAPQVMKIWFTPGFLARAPDTVATIAQRFGALSPQGYVACCAAVRDMDQREAGRAVTRPVLVVIGSGDTSTPPAMGEALAAAIPHARTLVLPAAHLSNVEQPEDFTRAVVDFFENAGVAAPPNDARHQAGMRVRRAVLGDAWVDKANAGKTPFTAEFQEFITRTAWGDIWTRPGLDRRTRSVIVLSTTVALGAWGEFRLHVRAAFNNGLTRDDIKEILMQCAIYSGVPMANHAFKEAQSVLAEMDAER